MLIPGTATGMDRAPTQLLGTSTDTDQRRQIGPTTVDDNRPMRWSIGPVLALRGTVTEAESPSAVAP
jgi:hypothetical protein